jgi:DHA3 family tetracycline resistance protein-like MFS transporter
VVADIYSRRLSIIIGYFLIGVAFLVEGFFPAFLPILLAQVLWAFGYTFTSGASEAWLSDEVGEKAANQLFLRANRLGLLASLAGIGLAIPFGSHITAAPIRLAGAGTLLVALTLAVIMPESGFRPAPREDRNTWAHMRHVFRQGLAVVRARPRLLTILGVGLFFGLYSEGFDRLWVKHMLDSFSLPTLFGQTGVGFFGLVRLGAILVSIAATRLVEKRVDTGSPLAIGRLMLGITGGLAAALVAFALSPWLSVAVVIYWTISGLRNVSNPLHTAWVNQRLDPQVRATVLSMTGQVDAIGQVAGGPAVGLIARWFSVAAAIATSGLLLTPALWLAARANAQSDPVGFPKASPTK